MAWKRWTDDDPHPHAAKAEREGQRIGEFSHETRFYTQDGKRWPLVVLGTQLVAPGGRLPCVARREIVPAVNLQASLLTGPDVQFDQPPFHAGIPVDLVDEAIDMLRSAAEEARRLAGGAR